jgi:hypothetical protein
MYFGCEKQEISSEFCNEKVLEDIYLEDVEEDWRIIFS